MFLDVEENGVVLFWEKKLEKILIEYKFSLFIYCVEYKKVFFTKNDFFFEGKFFFLVKKYIQQLLYLLMKRAWCKEIFLICFSKMRKQRNFYLLKVEKNLFALFIGIEEKTEKEKKQRECFFLEKRRTEGKEERERGKSFFFCSA